MMDVQDQFELEHLLFDTRKCRKCGVEKDLITDFYRTRKDRGPSPSSYSYECKSCTIKRIKYQRNHQRSKKDQQEEVYWYYPDW